MSSDPNVPHTAPDAVLSLPIKTVDLTGLTPTDTREWLVTNGLGSYASGSITGANTRRYHGLFVAALNPPVQRTLLLSRLDETLGDCPLATNFWLSGQVAPQGYKYLQSFSDLPCPTWIFRIPASAAQSAGRLTKRVLMVHGQSRVYVCYSWQPDDGQSAANLNLEVLLNYRDFHGQTRGADDWHFAQNQIDSKQVVVTPFNGAQSFVLQFSLTQNESTASYTQKADWYRDYYWPREHERGLAESEDCFHSGGIHADLPAGQSLTFTCGMQALDTVPTADSLLAIVTQAQTKLLQYMPGQSPGNGALPTNLQRLILAADQFLAHRTSTNGSTIIAGYHWFSDWGRDSMISLPGLCLSTNRPDLAKSILATFGKYLSEGMLPNFFPDGGQIPEYNTADATLWWAEALGQYFKATGDKDFVREQLKLLQDVVVWHEKGTRHGLHLASDGLVSGGGSDVQLTWMDAKCGNFVVTPRSGKAVEISALWYNFLRTIDDLQKQIGDSNGTTYSASADQTRLGFEQFWDEKRSYLADVIRQDGSIDESLRPNQLLAASLTFPIVSRDRAKAIVAAVEAKLLTPMGLRTLSPDHPDYKGLYGSGLAVADQMARDLTYHQGTVWPWLLGPWVNARLYAYGETAENFALIRAHLKDILAHIERAGCLGSVSEIFDGDAPHKPQGCVAQAWSVAELLRVLVAHPQLAAE